jgi:hypothetical protein
MYVVNHGGIVAEVLNAINNATVPIKHIELNQVEMATFLAVPEFQYAEGVGLTGRITNVKNTTNTSAQIAALPSSFRFDNVLIKLTVT